LFDKMNVFFYIKTRNDCHFVTINFKSHSHKLLTFAVWKKNLKRLNKFIGETGFCPVEADKIIEQDVSPSTVSFWTWHESFSSRMYWWKINPWSKREASLFSI
jgi:hypothetical protein